MQNSDETIKYSISCETNINPGHCRRNRAYVSLKALYNDYQLQKEIKAFHSGNWKHKQKQKNEIKNANTYIHVLNFIHGLIERVIELSNLN